MYKISERLATHGLGMWTEGGKFWNETKQSQTGKELTVDGKKWLIVDVRDLNDGSNPLHLYVEKVGMVRRAVEWAKFANLAGVVICCSAGQSRSNAIALAYLMDIGLSYIAAGELVATNPICNIDPSLLDDIKQVYPYTYTGRKI